MANSDSLPHSYCSLFNAITDCLEELDGIKQSHPQNTLLANEIDIVARRLAKKQQEMDDLYIQKGEVIVWMFVIL